MSDLVSPDPTLHPERPLSLLLIDGDPVFRTGFCAVAGQFSDLAAIESAQSDRDALQILQNGQIPIDLIILDLGSVNLPNGQNCSGLELCATLKTQYPHLPILLLSSFSEPVVLALARQLGVEGYCPKGCSVTELIDAIRQVGAGGFYWSNRAFGVFPIQKFQTRSLWLPTLLNNIRSSGLRQIEAALVEVNSELQNAKLSAIDRAILAGRRRELLSARALTNKLLGRPSIASVTLSELKMHSPNSDLQYSIQNRSGLSLLFDSTFAKIQEGLQNRTDVPLEIDIFREEKKRELLNLVLRNLQDAVDELRSSQVRPDRLPHLRSAILQDLWRAALTDFFGRYYTLSTGDRNLEVVSIILQDYPTVQRQILEKIPLVIDLFDRLLFETPLTIDNASYPNETPEAIAHSELLLQNLVIQVANAIAQPLLNRFGDVEVIKQNFYDKKLISTREIESFRNNLSWKYRLERYLSDPVAIFESRYDLLFLNGTGIEKTFIYAPRVEELKQLSGIQFAVTIALEIRDAIAPRSIAVVAFIGGGVVYLLTRVIGRGIGLIGRGIIEGIGNSLQENRIGRNGDRK